MLRSFDANVRPQDLESEAIALVKRWLDEAATFPEDAAAARLAGVLKDEDGLAFTVGFVDGVVRPEDLRSAAKNLRAIVPLTPKFLPFTMRSAIALGGIMSKPFPGVVVPIARNVLRQMVRHLIIDATDKKLGKAISQIQSDGVSLNINLLGEAILGQKEANRRIQGTHKLLDRPDVDYVSIKVSSTVAPHNHWGFAEAVEHIEQELLPLFRKAKQASPQKFINLDMEEYKDLDLTIQVFTQILDREEFKTLEAGIVLQAYLPDALSAMIGLQDWAAKRVAQGGAPIKVRVVKGANLPMELVDAGVHGWESATWDTKQASDTSYKAVLDFALHPERVKNVRIGVAGHNLFDVALAWLLAKRRGAAEVVSAGAPGKTSRGVEFEMLLGMATGQAEAVRREVGHLLLYVPVVHPAEFDVAIAYLIRRLEEGASQDNFMSAVFELRAREDLFARESERFRKSLNQLSAITGDGTVESYQVPAPKRQQDRRFFALEQRDTVVAERLQLGVAGEFDNAPDTDPDLPGNRVWGREIANAMVESTSGSNLVAEALVKSQTELETVLDTAVAASNSWEQLGATERARILYGAASIFEERRHLFLEVMGSECGKTIDQGDPEVSEAIDFANYYAMLGQQLELVDGARAVAPKLVAIIPPWNFPTAIPAGGVLAALAAGSSVVIKPATRSARSGAVMVEALWDAGVPRDVLQLVQFSDRGLASQFVADRRVERLVLTGAYETAVDFRNLRTDLPILAETSGKNAIIVTPSADLDLAAKDVALSAFGHAGQKCSAASLVILVGSVAKSPRFRNQLIDAVQSMKVGTPESLETQIGPVITAPSGKLLRGLTTLGSGEKWLVKPSPLASDSPLSIEADGTTKLWTPGIREGVKRGSEFHHTEYFGPVLGIMTADSIEDAVATVNEIEYGLTSGIHSLDREEIGYWVENIEAGNLYVNRGITGAIVRRQSFGGWKKSAIGAGTKAGGPNYLHGLVDWLDAPTRATGAKLPARIVTLFDAAREAGVAGSELEWLNAAFSSDVYAIADEFGIARDASGLGVEKNILRYSTENITIRFESDATLSHLVRVVGAGVAAGATPTVSSAVALPKEVVHAFASVGVEVRTENEKQWSTQVQRMAASEGVQAGHRIRLIAGASRADAQALISSVSAGKPDIAVYRGDVVAAGRVEMLPHLKEQAVSITAHRFGTVNGLTDGLVRGLI